MEATHSSGAASGRKVALVGHCVPDSFLLKNVIQKVVPGAEVVRVNDDSGVARAAEEGDLLLINRVLDGEFASDSGIGMIRSLAASATTRAALMLVSNLPEAHREAEQAGAVPGIGKATCGNEESAARIRTAVEGRVRTRT